MKAKATENLKNEPCKLKGVRKTKKGREKRNNERKSKIRRKKKHGNMEEKVTESSPKILPLQKREKRKKTRQQ